MMLTMFSLQTMPLFFVGFNISWSLHSFNLPHFMATNSSLDCICSWSAHSFNLPRSSLATYCSGLSCTLSGLVMFIPTVLHSFAPRGDDDDVFLTNHDSGDRAMMVRRVSFFFVSLHLFMSFPQLQLYFELACICSDLPTVSSFLISRN